MLKKLEDLPMFDQYISKDAKKLIDYKFWSRPIIGWKLSCDDEHSRASVLKAADLESDKADMYEGTIIVLVALSVFMGTFISFIMMVLFCSGCQNRRDFVATRLPGICCLGIQLVLLIVAFFLINGQRGELSERKKSMEDLEFVNGCGDEYMHIPDTFVPQIREASGKGMLAVIICGVQIALSLVLCISCAAGGGSKDHDDSEEDDNKYDLHENADEERNPLL